MKLSKGDPEKKNILFQYITSRNIDELSIVLERHANYSYLKINDKKVIKEFIDALKSDSYTPKYPTGQYNRRYYITLHSGSHSNLIELGSDTFNSGISKDSVEITLYDFKNIDVYDFYLKSKSESVDFSSLFRQSFGWGKFSLRNHNLYNVINNYIKDQGKI